MFDLLKMEMKKRGGGGECERDGPSEREMNGKKAVLQKEREGMGGEGEEGGRGYHEKITSRNEKSQKKISTTKL